MADYKFEKTHNFTAIFSKLSCPEQKTYQFEGIKNLIPPFFCKKSAMHRKKHPRKRKIGLPPGTLVYTGFRPEGEPEVKSVFYNETAFEELSEVRPDWLTRTDGVLWIDVHGLSDVAFIGKIGQSLNIHPLALEDALDTQQRAKLDEFDDGLFFILPHMRFQQDPLDIHCEQISVFFGPRFLVSFQEDPDDTFEPVRRRLKEGLGRLRKKGTDYLAYSLLDIVVDNYYNVLDDFETALQSLEEAMLHKGAEAFDKTKIFDLKRLIFNLRHRILPLRDEVMRFYRTESPLIDDTNRLYFRDVLDHVVQLIDSIDNYRDLIGNIEAQYHAEAANRLNNVMRFLTVISTIFIPLSFIAGIYGMNFDHMPELRTRNGYFIVLGAMGAAMIGMLLFFKRKRWI